MGNRIGVIEADEIERIGRLSVLDRAGCSVVDAATPDEAAEWGESDWRRLDVLLLGLAPDHSQWDRYGHLEIARAAHEAHPNLRVVALHAASMHPLVRVRLDLAGVRRACPSNLARTAQSLADLVHPRPHAVDRARKAACDVRGAIVGAHTDPTAVLKCVVDDDLCEVFDHADTQADTGLSRRAIIRIRSCVTRLGDLSVPSGYFTGGPCADRSMPSWRAVVDYVNCARGYDGVSASLFGDDRDMISA